MRELFQPSILVNSEVVHETVHTSMVSGKALEDVVIAAVAMHLGIDQRAPGIKVKCYLSCCSSASRIVHSAEVTITQDHRPQVEAADAASV